MAENSSYTMKSNIASRHIPYTTYHIRSARAFTLVELLIYIGALILALAVVVAAIAGFSRASRRVAVSQSLARSGATAMERIVRDVRNAQSIDQTGSVFGAHPGRLTIVTQTAPGVTTATEFRAIDGTVEVLEDGTRTGTITGDGVTVEQLVFYRIETPHSEAVRIVLTLSKETSASTVTATFYSAAVLRGSYVL